MNLRFYEDFATITYLPLRLQKFCQSEKQFLATVTQDYNCIIRMAV